MDWEVVFKIANASVLPAWFLLVFFPTHDVTRKVAQSYLYPMLLGLFYLVLMVHSFGGPGGMDSLQSLKVSFGMDAVLMLGWVHYLVFDLFVGAWMVRDAQVNHIAHWKTVPCLLLTLMAGPVGLLIYLIMRWFAVRKYML